LSASLLFFLVYGAEVVLPTDIEFDAPRVVQYTEKQAKEAHEASTSSRRHESRPWLDQRSTSSSCDDAIVERFVLSLFAKEISCSG
jgi:hypothetical protein